MQLEAFVALTHGSTEQHPVLADCYRAMGDYPKVEALWDELREASPQGSLVAEGRIVAAGAMADQGDLRGAIALLAKVVKITEAAPGPPAPDRLCARRPLRARR